MHDELTKGDIKKMQEEIDYRIKVLTPKLKEELSRARAQGDLSENAEYDAAKDEQRDIEARIEEIEKILKNAEVVDEDEAGTDAVSIGSRVTLKDLEYDEEVTYSIVGSTEANSLKGFISNESPLGKALLGKKAGDHIHVESPSGIVEYNILAIERNSDN